MTSVKDALLSLPVVAVALGALAVGLVELGRYWNFGLASLSLIAIPLVLAIAYSLWYRTLPYKTRGPPSSSSAPTAMGSGTEEPFEDPVEEADRLEQAAKSGPPPEAPAVEEDDGAAESPPSR